jgi:hypothetical protein
MGSLRKAAPEVRASRQRGRDPATAAESAETRCRAILKEGRRCKREGQPVFDGRSGRFLYYCIAHRRLLRERGLLNAVGVEGATRR